MLVPVPVQAGQHFNLGNVHEADRQVMVECSPGVHDVRSLSFSAAEHKPQMAWHANLYESEARWPARPSRSCRPRAPRPSPPVRGRLVLRLLR